MKKSLLLFTIPALALASCSSDETVSAPNGSGINFRASVENTGRGGLTSTATISNFAVTSFGDNQASNYFNDVLVKREGAKWACDLYYWPDFDLKFFAYSPAEVNGKPVITKDIQKISDFQVVRPTADQVDLLYAANAYPYSYNKDGVELNFRHAMSAIDINARVTNPTLEYEINAVKICQFYAKGNFSYPAVHGASMDMINNTAWSMLSDAEDFITKKGYGEKAFTKLNMAMENSGDTHPDGTSIMKDTDGSFIMIPQNLTPWSIDTKNADGAYISILCRIYTLDNKGGRTQIFPKVKNDNEGQFGFVAMPLDLKFQPGYKYTIRLDLNGGGYRDPNNTNPDDPKDPDIDPEPWPGPGPGPEILPGEISYTVSVTEWYPAGSPVSSVVDFKPSDK
ncbi:MAG: fimbrillin family protein [Duncaniella sp.]|uniref:fimbrillin family protein n=1 Tax=Duncaniella sp. TaxID=2518496 RepID=UPI0023D0E47C|nr:fimbrillin family protein [Duncaniella sp.]MDE5989373.1 fimbrillin family protein [Duncaniella sp.]